ncbi:MAG: 2-C-methyl-D-erythritol 4-phosphate cytidylyltransferase [Balneolales bacterium]|nr:2-C-methyl-D-erythritol 4-phosphate cytidylyltransferase [Balneolales bacterium]
MPDLSVIVPAAGSGSRMGENLPKPFLNLGGLPILSRTLRCFNYPNRVVEIVLAVSPEFKSLAKAAVNKADLVVPVKIVDGGSERMYSISNALAEVSTSAKFVAVHDAVRPFISRDLLDRLYNAVRESGACIPGISVTDTIKQIESDGIVRQTLLRDELRAVQTPQLFSLPVLREAYRFAISNQRFGTDDASLVEQSGYDVLLIDGEQDNFKITYPVDLKRAEEYIKSKLI